MLALLLLLTKQTTLDVCVCVCVCVCQRSLLRGELKSHTISPLSLSLSVRLDEAAGMDCVLT